MDLPNLGFGLFLVLLLIAPQVPVGGFDARVNVPLGAVGLVLWLMLAPRLPIRAVLTMPTLLGLIAFSLYAWLASFGSGRMVAIEYGAQYAFYAVVGGVLIPAYIVHRTRQGRQAEVWRILAWVGAIYLAGIIVSLWTGPIYPFQVGTADKVYGSMLIPRGVGFSDGANAAGGICAVLATFYLFLYRRAGRMSLLLSALGVLGLVATLSRSAIAAFVAAICVSGLVLILHAVKVRGALRVRLPIVPTTIVALALVAAVFSFQQPIVAAAWQRLVLDQTLRDDDVDARLQIWESHAHSWATKSFAQQFGGAGFKSGGVIKNTAVYHSAHNAYIEILNDFGLFGLLIFATTIAVALLKVLYRSFVQPSNALAMFCFTGLLALAIHNMTEIFFYNIATLVFLIILLTCGELAQRDIAPSPASASSEPGRM